MFQCCMKCFKYNILLAHEKKVDKSIQPKDNTSSPLQHWKSNGKGGHDKIKGKQKA